jgi:uncharacterized SAM-binding protein YcdF (DUF218 family)
MGHWLLWAIKDNFHLTSLVPLILALVLGLILLSIQRTARWGRRWLALVTLGYWALATPLGSSLIAAPLARGQHGLASAADANGAQAIVVLGGGIFSHRAGGLAIDDLAGSGLRLLEGVRLYRLLGDPWLVVSGGNTPRVDPPRPEGEAMRRAAIDLGVPTARILVDDVSMTTFEQAKTMSRMLPAHGITRFVLVTSPLHMPRSLAVFRGAGLDPIPSPSAARSESDDPFWSPLPDRQSLSVSDAVVYEYAARLYYWWRGWLNTPPT